MNKESVLASKLSSKGIRLTRQRRILLEVIENAPHHVHASDLLRLAQEQDERIDRATVYRTLAMLKEYDLIEELDLLHLDGTEHHYEVCDGKHHVHIACTKCGRITEFDSGLVVELEKEIREKMGFDIGAVRIEVGAVCPECRG